MENRWTGFLVLAFILVVAALLATHEWLPEPLPTTAPPDVFSAERALAHLNTFATAPHPLGSGEHDRVRDYLVSRLTALGVPPEIQKATGVTPRYRVAGTVENIVARLKGSGGSADAIALVAHYDSVPAGPGAADDGAGVAALLETLRALRSGPPLRNDILFLITDGEEDGLLGASAFVAENSAAKDIRVVINFEARGNSSESQLFETSANNGRLVELFAQSSPHPSASSLTYEVYRRMPNDTDLTIFKRAGDPGLNFAFIGNWEAYHTRLDNPQMLDRGSLQQQGENALSLARSLGNADLARLQDRDAVYFSLPPNLFVHYSARFIEPLAIGSGVLLLVVIFYGIGAWQASPLKILVSVFISTGVLLLLPLLGFGFFTVVRWFHLHALPEGGLEHSNLYVLGLLALLFAVLVCLWHLLSKRIPAAAFFLGSSILIFVFLLAVSKWLSGGSYLFVWPLLAALLAAIAAGFRPGHRSYLRVLILCLLSLPALLLFVLLLKGFYEALGFTTMGAPLLSLTFGVAFLLLFPSIEPVLESSGKLLALVALFAGIVLCVTAARATHYSAEHPKPSLLAYALDADSGKAVWASTVRRLDPWTAQYLGASPMRAKLPDFYPDWYPVDFLQHEARALSLQPPQAALLVNHSDGDTRMLNLGISSPRHARVIRVAVSGAEVLSASVNGRDLGKPSEARWNQSGAWSFEYCNPSDGMVLQLRLQGTSPVRIVLVDRSSGLPTIPGVNLPPRPSDSMAIHSGDQTMVRRSFVF